MIKEMLKQYLKAVKEVLKRHLKAGGFLAILGMILGSIFFFSQWLFSQIGLYWTIAIIIAILLIYILSFVVTDQHIKLTEKETAEDKLRKDLRKCENPNLKIETIKQTIHIEGPNVRVEREFCGRNYSNEKLSYFVAQVGGDKPITLNELSFMELKIINLPLEE